MGTKNLARTVIEGGRTGHNKYSRRKSHRVVRRKLTMALIAAGREMIPSSWRGAPFMELWEPELGAFEPQPVRRDFNDRLNPLWRWMDSRVGRLWDEVHAEVRARFDTHTTAGRHIVYCHLLDSVRRAGDPRAEYSRYQIDEEGILRGSGQRIRSWRLGLQSRVTKTELREFADGRKIVQHGSELFWLVLTDNLRTCHGACEQGSHYHSAYRQDARLTEDEREFYSRLDAETQRRIMNVLLVAF